MFLIRFTALLFILLSHHLSESYSQETILIKDFCNPDSGFVCYGEEMPIFLGDKQAFINSLKKEIQLKNHEEYSGELYLTFGFIVSCQGKVTKVHVFNHSFKNHSVLTSVSSKLKATTWLPGTKDGKVANIVNYLVTGFRSGKMHAAFL